MDEIETVKEFGGYLKRFQHKSDCCNCDMTFSIYIPPQAEHTRVPSIYWLSGLTCTDDNFRTKAGAQRYASENGVALIIPDTSPRGDNVPDYPDRYNLGQGAGFYVNATTPTWKNNYQMYNYIVNELPQLVESFFPVIRDKKSIFGHSMGGHGALVCALRNPQEYKSVSAFAPIYNPSKSPWGRDCFTTYLGVDESLWKKYDATYLVIENSSMPLLIDQGSNDEFIDTHLYPNNLKKACEEIGMDLNLRVHKGYDHSYHFISTFIGEHISFHSEYLK
jgi:S-formylglutathione hydrolase|tara:strand:+ start:5459 stop:6289 length:831 start_codon:yes stop_codon:yes gene_type:complete